MACTFAHDEIAIREHPGQSGVMVSNGLERSAHIVEKPLDLFLPGATPHLGKYTCASGANNSRIGSPLEVTPPLSRLFKYSSATCLRSSPVIRDSHPGRRTEILETRSIERTSRSGYLSNRFRAREVPARNSASLGRSVERWTGIRPVPRIHLRLSAGCRNWP